MKNLMKALAAVVVGCAALIFVDTSVRADAPVGHFAAPVSGTVRDNLTGLVWRQDFSPPMQTQASSLAYCAGLGSVGEWRLPTVLELSSIVDETRGGSLGTAATDPVFVATPRDYFWSASPVTGFPGLGWRVSFFDGAVDPHDVTVDIDHYARCVR